MAREWIISLQEIKNIQWMIPRISLNICFAGLVYFLIFLSIHNLVQAQESSQIPNSSEVSIYDSQVVSDESPDESHGDESDLSDSVIEETSLAISVIDFWSLLPYGQYIEYVYAGDGNSYPSFNVIMEFSPDRDGRFQVSRFIGESAQAIVYQANEDGLFELARFEDYLTVEDLRYSDPAMDEEKSLILPADLELGAHFQTGYNQESQVKVDSVIDEFYIGDQVYYKVLKLVESLPSEGEEIRYLAPDAGLIAVQELDPQGNVQTVLQLDRFDGYIGF